MDKSKLLKNLNQEQLKAVTHKNGPMLIIAGAGTGKTKAITHRIAWLIEQKLAKPSEILALTFTEKAAQEMEERVDVLVPYGFVDTWISTFHAFGDRILRDYSLQLGLPPTFKILSETEQAIFLRENIYSFELNHFRPKNNPLTHIESMLTHFSRLKDELITPKDYLKFAQNRFAESKKANLDENEIAEAEKTLELAYAYNTYNNLMLESGNLDYGDQIFLAYQLLKNNPQILANYQKQFKYILIDEYQDTNFAQNEIVKLLSGKNGNITVVGDDDQSIYRFRGASISNILDFKNHYPDATQVILNKNYRSTQEILDSSYKLIQNNNPDRLEIKNKIDKKLIGVKHGAEPELIYCNNLSCEADKVAKKIIELKEKQKLNYKDFAILVRANSNAKPFIESLNLSGIPHIFSGATDLFSQNEIKMLIAFLKCLVYSDDNLAFYTLAKSEIYNIPDEKLITYYTTAKRLNRPIKEVFNIEQIKNPDKNDEKIQQVLSDIDEFRMKNLEPAGEVLYEFLTQKQYLKNLSATESIENELKIYNIAKFFDLISQFNHSSQDRGVMAFLKNLELILEFNPQKSASDIDPSIDAVNILTVHAAKGLEWPVVFITNVVSDRFPSRKRSEQLPIPEKLIKENLPEGDFHLQEERRLFYVAATRAKDYLFLTAAEDYGGKRVKKLSPFALELLDSVSKEKITQKLSPLEKIQRFKTIQKENIKIPEKFTSDIIKLSRAQIDDYHTCPKKFYYAHVVKIPLLENRFLMYGTAIHAALNYYFSRKISGTQPTLDQLLADYRKAFKNVGFITRDQEDLVFQQGLDTLTKFFNFDQKQTKNPYKVEESFEFNLNNIKINGRFDLIYKIGDDFEICDFKTSDVKTSSDAKRRINQSTQMMLYALAWQAKTGKIPKTTLYFIESNLAGEKTFTQKEINKVKDIISEVGEGLKKKDFHATPDARQCKLCPYKNICPNAI